jgi:hypothetical protein
MEPKFVIMSVGGHTNVFFEGKSIAEGILDIHYHATDENGKLRATIDMKIDAKSFSFDKGQTMEEFLQDVDRTNKAIAEGNRKKNALSQI